MFYRRAPKKRITYAEDKSHIHIAYSHAQVVVAFTFSPIMVAYGAPIPASRRYEDNEFSARRSSRPATPQNISTLQQRHADHIVSSAFSTAVPTTW